MATKPSTDDYNLTAISSHDLLLHLDFINYYDLLKPETTTRTQPNIHQNSYLTSPNQNSPFIFGITILYSILIIASLTSNPLLIYVLLVRRKAQIKLIDIFVANLSLSDLLLTIFNIPLSLLIYFSDEWPFGSLLCQVGTYSTSCSIYVNIFTMVYISIDRYFAITSNRISNPYGQRKKSILLNTKMRRKIYTALGVIWVISLALSVPQFLFTRVSVTKFKTGDAGNRNFSATKTLDAFEFGGYNYDYDILPENRGFGFHEELSEDPFKKCLLSYPKQDMKFYMTFLNFSFQYLIPLLVILYFYGKIIYHLYLNLNIAEFMDSKTDLRQESKKRNLTKKGGDKAKLTYKINAIDDLRYTNQRFLKSKQSQVRVSQSTYSLATSVRGPSRMRIEGINRTHNLKKSIKVMIIIIALFLLSWLPIHLYRLVTTYVPLIRSYSISPSQSPETASINQTQSLQQLLTQCQNSTDKFCVYSVINRAIDQIKVTDVLTNATYNTLHNPYVFFICYFMSMSSVCYNPIVYFWMHKKFRAEVKQIFGRIFQLGYLLRTRTSRILTFSSMRTSSSDCKNSQFTESLSRNGIILSSTKLRRCDRQQGFDDESVRGLLSKQRHGNASVMNKNRVKKTRSLIKRVNSV